MNSDTNPDSGSLARRVPLDLLATVALALLAAAVLVALPTRAPLTDLLGASAGALTARLVTLALGLPLLLFLPGYAAVAVLFPGRDPDVERLDAEENPVAPRFQFRERESIDGPARVTLAIGVSAVVTPVTALVVNFTPWGLYARPLVVALAGVVVVGSLAGAVVRLRLPPEDRFAPTLRPASSALFSGDSDLGAANLVLAVGVLVAVAGIGFAVAVPKPGAQFTELYLLSEDENGTLVADDYPAFAGDDPEPLVVGVENHEGQNVTYSLVVERQRVEPGGSAVVNETQLARTEVTVASGERKLTRFDLSPETGPNSRLRVLLYRGPVPADPTAESAYRHVVLWLGERDGNATTERNLPAERETDGSRVTSGHSVRQYTHHSFRTPAIRSQRSASKRGRRDRPATGREPGERRLQRWPWSI